ncbi:MAG: hypothetical protein R3264_12875, partial [Anaerolineae bacterium]|nr:hypothetical protein [Anaerolineae bacterium]
AAFRGSFTLVAVEAPIETLVERIAARARADEAQEVMQQKQVARQMILGESGRGEPAHGHHINATMELANVAIDNSGDMAYLETQVASFAAQLVSAFNT